VIDLLFVVISLLYFAANIAFIYDMAGLFIVK